MIFEVLSREDRLSRIKLRLADFVSMGVPEVWLIDPETAGLDRFEGGKLVRREQFAFARRDIVFSVAEIA